MDKLKTEKCLRCKTEYIVNPCSTMYHKTCKVWWSRQYELKEGRVKARTYINTLRG